MASKLVKALIRSQILPSTRRHFSAPATTQLGEPTGDLVGNHTKKWMQIAISSSYMVFDSSRFLDSWNCVYWH
ncbi:hypothetical protein F2Q68_00033271 [Brassica cretica]|uniref:Uncharacterized protein n=1 Tax=Brassica cretica TaxID=69181 RepID=A0A8S9GAB5_BRACR|nr:hypothetical protein F2Q68_00033271 [Brassica cretica]